MATQLPGAESAPAGRDLSWRTIGRVHTQSRVTGLSYSRFSTPHRKRDVSRPETTVLAGDVVENRVLNDCQGQRYGHWAAKPHSGVLAVAGRRRALELNPVRFRAHLTVAIIMLDKTQK